MKEEMDMEKYFYFDDKNKEIVFTRQDMPSPWLNYLTNGELTTMISQAGGGLTFYKSPQIWRITRYKFYNLPMDSSGLYLYIVDKKTGDVWCPTFVPRTDEKDKRVSAHGMGYTRFSAKHKGVKAELVYYVCPDENALVCDLTLDSKTDRELEVYASVELGLMEYMRETQWICYLKHQVSVDYDNSADALLYTYGVDEQPRPNDTPLAYFAGSKKCVSYDGDRDEYIGCYRGEANPYAIEKGGCTGSTLKGGDPMFAMQFDVKLTAGKKENLKVFLGAGQNVKEIETSLTRLRKENFCEEQFIKLKENWREYLSKFEASVPDEATERTVNIWNPYQAHKNFLFSRNISYYATGTFRGVGFRDTAQDTLAMIPFDVDAAKNKLKLLLTQQYRDGHTNHYFFPEEHWDPLVRTHSDNHLWTIFAVYRIIAEEGSDGILRDKVEYFDGGSGTVWEHLKAAIEFTQSHLGANGFPLMLHSDWNDMLSKVCREGKGESIFVSQTLCIVCSMMAEMAALIGESGDRYKEIREQQAKLLDTVAWDGEWFRRATMDSGEFLGSKSCPQAKIWLNTQSWAVLSGAVDRDKCIKAMDSVKKYLDTPFGIKKIHPAMKDYPTKEDPLTVYNKGCGENGSVFCHANAWAVIAECMLGRGNNAYKYYSQLIPLNAMKEVGLWRYKAEPYAYSSNLFGPESDKPGLANVSWLTGTSSWMYIAATQYILGVRPSLRGLTIDPCIPSEWNGFSVKRKFRGCEYSITVENPGHIEKGEVEVYLDGVKIDGNTVLSSKKRANVKVIMK